MEKCERIKNETVRKEADLKINFYTLVWAFVTGCVLGYCYEITWYFFKEGHFVNRQAVKKTICGTDLGDIPVSCF